MNKRWLISAGVLLLSLMLVSGALAAARSGLVKTEPQAALFAQAGPQTAVPAPRATGTPPFLEEHFDMASFPPPGWRVVNHGGNCTWGDETGEPFPEGNLTAGYDGFADADSDTCGSGTSMDTSLVSPVFNLSLAPTGTALEFASDYRFASTQVARVEISGTNILTWTTIWSTTTSNNGLVFVDLTPYVGSGNAQLRFHFTSPGWGFWWQIDDVMVVPPAPALEFAHQAPAHVPYGAAIPYTVTLSNVGGIIASPLTLTNPMPPGMSYVNASLGCVGGAGSCTYDPGTQQILWTGSVSPSTSITLTFTLTPSAPQNACSFVDDLVQVTEGTYGLYLEDRIGTEILPQVYARIDFENSPGGFSGSGNWAWGAPDPASAPRGPQRAYNGNSLWGTNLAGAYGLARNVLSRTLDLTGIPSTPTGAMLAWKEWVDLRPGDTANVYINKDLLLVNDGVYNRRVWAGNGIDLTPYIGQVVTVTFELQGGGGIPYSGWYIDSLAITEGCPFVTAGWGQSVMACPGDQVPYPIYTENRTYLTQTFSLNVSGNTWLTSLSSNNFPLAPGTSNMVTATVNVPLTAPYGSMDTAYIQATSSPEIFSTIFTLTTKIGDNWLWEAPLPGPNMNGAAVSYNNETYYFPGGGVTDTLKYDPLIHAWIPLTPQPAPAYATNEACLGTNAGGAPVAVLFPNTAAASPALHIYNILADSWSNVPITGFGPLDGISVAADPTGNLCYVSGGLQTSGVATNTLYAFSPVSNTFTPLAPMPQPRAMHASWMTADGRVCVAGGVDASNAPLDSTQCYDPSTNTWEAANTSFGRLPFPLWGMAETQWNSPSDVWLLGGSSDVYFGGAVAPRMETLFWDSIGLTWTKGTPLPMPTYYASADVQDGAIFIIGGNHPVPNGTEWLDQPGDDQWRLRVCQAQPAAQADLWLNKVADPPVVAVNTPFTYTLEVGNAGPSWATNVIVEDYLPAGMTVTLPTTPACVLGGGVFTCTLGSIPPGGVAYITLQAASSITGTRMNQASALASEPDPDYNNNLAAAQSYITAQAIQSPLIFDVMPPEGINITNTVITITGMNFQPGLTVTLDLTPLIHLRKDSGLIEALVPASLPPGSYDISVINPDGQYDTAVNAFTVYGDTSPRVYDVFPSHGPNDMPMGLIIVGENFIPGTTAVLSRSVPLNLQVAAPLTMTLGGNYFINSNMMIAFVPKGVLSGTYDLVVFNPDGRFGILSKAYTVVDANQTDLYGNKGDLWTDPYTVRSGQTITVGATVRRQGGMSSTMSSVDVAFFLGNPANGGAPLGVGSTGAIPGRGFHFATISVDLTSVPPGYYDLYAVIDPANQVAEFDETNNVLSYTLTVLPPNLDTTPPVITDFRIDGGSQSTRDIQVTLELSATDDTAPAYVFFIEYAYLQALGSWWPVNLSGWKPYDPVKHAALYATPGVHYVQAWVADAAGNISMPGSAWINLLSPATPIGKEEMHPYRLRLAAGESVRVRLTSGTGDADLYVFAPDNSFIGSSENSTPVDEVVFTATQDGVYQIEVEGYAASSTYTLEVLPGTVLLPNTPAPAGVQVPKQRGRNRPILSVTEEPSTNTGLETVPDTLYTINLPLIMR